MRVVRVIAIVALVLAVLLGVQFYIGWNGKAFLDAVTGGVPAVPFWIVYGIVAMSYIISRLLERVVPGPHTRGLKWIGSYWFAILQYGVLLLPLADLAVWALRGASVPADEAVAAVGFATIAVLLAILVRGSLNAWRPIVREYTVTVDKRAGELRELRIAAASDLHLGTLVGRRYLRQLVDRVNALRPDIVLLPGDVIDDDVEPFRRLDMAAILKDFQSRFGTYAVLGNHEYIGGKIDEYIGLMTKAGIPVLTDESVKIADSFYIVGRKDKSAGSARFGRNGRLSIAELVTGLDRSLPIILLDHQPSAISEAAGNGVDLSLHGHTHRGQMAPNHLLTRRLFELDWGYLRKGTLHAIVSSGYGTWGPPIRIGSRSEIVDITVRFRPEP